MTLADIIITIPQWGRATSLELVWLALGILTTGICLKHLPDFWKDWLAAISTGRPAMRVNAFSYVRREVIRLINGLGILGLGLYAVLTPPLVPGPARVSLIGLIVTAVFFMFAGTSALMSHWDHRDRVKIEELLTAEFKEKE